jgi:hypothetical protein
MAGKMMKGAKPAAKKMAGGSMKAAKSAESKLMKATDALVKGKIPHKKEEALEMKAIKMMKAAKGKK